MALVSRLWFLFDLERSGYTSVIGAFHVVREILKESALHCLSLDLDQKLDSNRIASE